MNERDELAYVIYDAAEAADYDDGWHQKAADAVHAAGYRKPREVSVKPEDHEGQQQDDNGWEWGNWD